MKKLKKTLSLALAGCMAASMLVTGAFAADMPSYSDVPANAAYAEAVEYLSAGKIMDGIGDGKFGPQDTVTRAMAVTVLGCMAGAEEAEANAFTDVVPNSWYSGYVGWASENGIVQGDGSGRFMPDRMVTSEELNLMLGRYAALAEKNADLYDTGAATVTRADLAQRLYALAQADSSAPVMPAVVQLDKRAAGCPAAHSLSKNRDTRKSIRVLKWRGRMVARGREGRKAFHRASFCGSCVLSLRALVRGGQHPAILKHFLADMRGLNKQNPPRWSRFPGRSVLLYRKHHRIASSHGHPDLR